MRFTRIGQEKFFSRYGHSCMFKTVISIENGVENILKKDVNGKI